MGRTYTHTLVEIHLSLCNLCARPSLDQFRLSTSLHLWWICRRRCALAVSIANLEANKRRSPATSWLFARQVETGRGRWVFNIMSSLRLPPRKTETRPRKEMNQSRGKVPSSPLSLGVTGVYKSVYKSDDIASAGGIQYSFFFDD